MTIQSTTGSNNFAANQATTLNPTPLTPPTNQTPQSSQTNQTPQSTQPRPPFSPFGAPGAGGVLRSQLQGALAARFARTQPDSDSDDDDVDNYEDTPQPGAHGASFDLKDVLYGTTHALGQPSEAEVKSQIGVPEKLPLTMAFEYRSAMPFLDKAEKAFQDAQAKGENPHKAFAAIMAKPFPGTKFDKEMVETLREFHGHINDSTKNHYKDKPIGPHTLLKGNNEATGNMRPFVRTSKVILDFALKSGGTVNMVTTDMNMQETAGKTRHAGMETPSGKDDGSRITESEIRFLYRQSGNPEFAKRMQFWELGSDKKTLQKTETPWAKDPALWATYTPASGQPGAAQSTSTTPPTTI